LGEIFDHGVDAFVHTLIAYMFAKVNNFDSSLYFEYSIYYFPFMWAIFFTSHWEHFHTNKFVLGYLSSGDGINLIMLQLFSKLIHFDFVNFKLGELTVGNLIILIIFINCFATSSRIIISTLLKNFSLNAILDLIPLGLISLHFIYFCKFNAELWTKHQELTSKKLKSLKKKLFCFQLFLL
jgi:hypothetical protein